MEARPTAAIVTVGTELTSGLRRDTNGGEVARALADFGYRVASIAAMPDDVEALARELASLTAAHSLVVVTGGLGPTHDDITREAASRALGRPLVRDEAIAVALEAHALRHGEPRARAQLSRQADVLEGARVLPAVAGTAPGQLVPTAAGNVLLLPGPPSEMRPLLASVLQAGAPAVLPVRLRCIGITESDCQHRVQPAIAPYPVELTLLASPDDVEAILFATEGGADDLGQAAKAATDALGAACYSADGTSLAEVVVNLARAGGARLACAESCTGGLVAAALTDVPGVSDVFSGGVVAYANAVKTSILGVPADTLARFGAVSAQAARSMAEGALLVGDATVAVSTTGIAGPGGGTADRPVGLVWFGIAKRHGRSCAIERRFGGDRDMVRRRAAATALDLLRHALLEE